MNNNLTNAWLTLTTGNKTSDDKLETWVVTRPSLLHSRCSGLFAASLLLYFLFCSFFQMCQQTLLLILCRFLLFAAFKKEDSSFDEVSWKQVHFRELVTSLAHFHCYAFTALARAFSLKWLFKVSLARCCQQGLHCSRFFGCWSRCNCVHMVCNIFMSGALISELSLRVSCHHRASLACQMRQRPDSVYKSIRRAPESVLQASRAQSLSKNRPNLIFLVIKKKGFYMSFFSRNTAK